MKKVVAAVAMLVLCAGSVWADGLPRSGSKVAAPEQPVWSPEKWLPTATTDTNWTGGYAGLNGAVGPWARDDLSYDAGGQLGYRWHWQGGVVLGFEVDFGKTWFKERGDYETASEVEYSGSARSIVGFATGKTLLYGTAGIGAQSLVRTDASDAVVVRDRGWAAPWVYGTGVEYRATERVSVGVEWLRFQGEAFHWDTEGVDRDTIRGRVNFKF